MPHAANEYTQCSKGYLQHNPAPALLHTPPLSSLPSSIYTSDTNRTCQQANACANKWTTLQHTHFWDGARFNNVNCAHTFPSFHYIALMKEMFKQKRARLCFAIPQKSEVCDNVPPDSETWIATRWPQDMLQMAQAWQGYMEKDRAACCKSFALLEKVTLYKKRQQMQVCRLHAYYFMRISCLIYPFFLFYMGTHGWNSGGQHWLYNLGWSTLFYMVNINFTREHNLGSLALNGE